MCLLRPGRAGERKDDRGWKKRLEDSETGWHAAGLVTALNHFIVGAVPVTAKVVQHADGRHCRNGSYKYGKAAKWPGSRVTTIKSGLPCWRWDWDYKQDYD